MANNRASADYFIHSSLMGEEYDRHVMNFQRSVDQRVAERISAPEPEPNEPAEIRLFAPDECACL